MMKAMNLTAAMLALAFTTTMASAQTGTGGRMDKGDSSIQQKDSGAKNGTMTRDRTGGGMREGGTTGMGGGMNNSPSANPSGQGNVGPGTNNNNGMSSGGR